MTVPLFIGPLRTALVGALLLLGWIGPVLPASGSTCGDLLARAPRTLYEVSAVYGLLRDLDRAGCAKMSEAAFETFTQPIELNLVSYVLLETRLMDGGESLRDDLLAAHLQRYRDASLDLDENAILPLIDVAFYACKGEAACIRTRVLSLTASFALTKAAGCLYAMPSRCEPDLLAGLAFLNDATLEAFASPREAFAKRADFICHRYRDCDRPLGAERR